MQLFSLTVSQFLFLSDINMSFFKLRVWKSTYTVRKDILSIITTKRCGDTIQFYYSVSQFIQYLKISSYEFPLQSRINIL